MCRAMCVDSRTQRVSQSLSHKGATLQDPSCVNAEAGTTSLLTVPARAKGRSQLGLHQCRRQSPNPPGSTGCWVLKAVGGGWGVGSVSFTAAQACKPFPLTPSTRLPRLAGQCPKRWGPSRSRAHPTLAPLHGSQVSPSRPSPWALCQHGAHLYVGISTNNAPTEPLGPQNPRKRLDAPGRELLPPKLHRPSEIRS